MHRLLSATLVWASVCTGCVKEISAEERLEREVPSTPRTQALGAEELSKVSCQQADQELAPARDESRPEAERVLSYVALFESLKSRRALFDEAMNRNPDLAYQPGSKHLVQAQQTCAAQLADTQVEFERYVRELVEVPTVKEVTGGKEVVVARLDFAALREAIEALNPNDKEQLLSRLAYAEKKVETPPDDPKKRTKR